MREKIKSSLAEAVSVIEFLQQDQGVEFIIKASEMIAECFSQGNKVLIAGNGGSLCDASHFAEELTGQFRHRRKALPAIALNDPGHMSCVGNDMGFDQVFARGVDALGSPNDLLIVLTTSGNSLNLVNAVLMAQSKGLKTISFLGKTGGKLLGMCDLELVVPGFSYSDRIQEAHMTAIHILIEMVETRLFSPSTEKLSAATF